MWSVPASSTLHKDWLVFQHLVKVDFLEVKFRFIDSAIGRTKFLISNSLRFSCSEQIKRFVYSIMHSHRGNIHQAISVMFIHQYFFSRLVTVESKSRINSPLCVPLQFVKLRYLTFRELYKKLQINREEDWRQTFACYENNVKKMFFIFAFQWKSPRGKYLAMFLLLVIGKNVWLQYFLKNIKKNRY